MSSHPGAMDVAMDPPAGAGEGSRELSPGLDGVAWGIDDLRSDGSQGSYCGVSRYQ